MRRASSTDRTSLGPLRVKNDNNVPQQRKRSSSLSRQSVGNRSGLSMGTGSHQTYYGRQSMSGRPSISGRTSISGTNRRSGIPMSKANQNKKPRLTSSTPRKSNLGVRGGAAKDPRPVSDRSYQQRCINTVLTFLTTNGYPYNITPKILQSPPTKDFYKIFEFIMKYYSPYYKIPVKPEDEIPKTLKSIGYPFLISKTSMFALGTPHTWPHMLAALVFMIDNINYKMEIDLSVEGMLFPPEDDFDSIPETQIEYQYMEKSYQAYMFGKDEFDEEDAELKASIRQRCLGVSHMDELLDEHTALKDQLERLDQEGDELKLACQALQNLTDDEEKFVGYLRTLETHKQENERLKSEIEEQVLTLKNDLHAKDIVLEKMKEIELQQEFSQEDVERIHQRSRELKAQIDVLDKSMSAVNETIWKEEMTIKAEEAENKRREYNQMAMKLKLIPLSAENSGGVDYEMRKATYNDRPADFLTVIKPALMTLNVQCSESASRKETEKIKLMGQLEQVMDNLADVQNQVSLLKSKYKRVDSEVESKRQLYQKEREQLQEMCEEVQNDIVQLASSASTGLDLKREKTKIDKWGKQEEAKSLKRVSDYSNFFKDALNAILEHMETVQENLKATDKVDREYEDTVRQAEALGVDLSKLQLS